MGNSAMRFFFYFLFPFFALSAFGNANGRESESSCTIKKPTVILDLVTTQLEEPENPKFISYEISGKVLLGNNKCYAKGYSAKVITHEDNEHKEVVHVRAFLEVDKDDKRPIRYCTQQYDPIYEEFTVQVEAQKIVIHNVDRMKNDVVLEPI